LVDPTGSETYSHDADGRVTQLSKVINSLTYNTGYQYDAGAMSRRLPTRLGALCISDTNGLPVRLQIAGKPWDGVTVIQLRICTRKQSCRNPVAVLGWSLAGN
jgi:hypothetical protein